MANEEFKKLFKKEVRKTFEGIYKKLNFSAD